MKRLTAIMLLAASCALAQEETPELVQLKQRATVMQALSEITPITVTNHAPFKARLAAVATRLQETDWQEVRQQLPKIPKTTADAAAALHVAVRAPAFLVTKYQGYYIISDVSVSAEPSTLPLGDKPQLTAKLRDILLSDPEAFMSGFAVPVDTAKWMKYDFRKTYMLTPKGVKIERNTIAEPSTEGDGLKPAP